MTTRQNSSIEAFKEKGRCFASGEGKGVQMKKFKPYTDFVLKNLVHKADIINPDALLPSDGHPVIAITSHGPGAAWIPLVALVGKFFLDNGYGDIVGGMYPHKALFLIPGLKDYYRRVLGTPTDINSVNDIVALLKNNDIGLAGTAPEGANCLLSFNKYVAPFRSKGMIAAAIKADASICLMAHQGAEKWNIRINLPFGLTVPGTNGVRGVNIALPPYKKIKQYMVLCRRYAPAITSADLEGKTKTEVRRLLNFEIEKIRMELNLMTDEIKALMGQPAIDTQKTRKPQFNSWERKQIQIRQAMFPADEAYLACN
ncbi:MAG: hypothetical protein MUE70_13040 [Desulfobacterales bacterium]|jgi:hypothetical protein|nr:hypothetical protein [Desulfobacterales bacterium]